MTRRFVRLGLHQPSQKIRSTTNLSKRKVEIVSRDRLCCLQQIAFGENKHPVKNNPPKSLSHGATLLASILLAGCASTPNDNNPPCRRVDATEFMRPHTFKGVATDRFIGVTMPLFPSSDSDERRAFKEIWEVGNFHSWAVLWIPARELPADYLTNAPIEPNRPARPRTP